LLLVAVIVARLAYGKDYYAGFAYDPDGHKVEAVVGGVG
jgi:hypothetical protein